MDLGSIWTIFLFFFSILACRPITVLVHELGHAIPSLFFTKEKVTIYVGSHGDINKSLFFNIGRLQGVLSYDIFQAQMGLCTHSPTTSIKQTLWIILGGPLASLLFGFLLIGFVNFFEFPPLLNFIMYLLLVSSIFDFFTNMIPSKNPSYLFDGTPVYNDGNSFFKLLKESKYPPTYFKAINLFQNGKLKRAIHNLHKVLEEGVDDKLIYNHLVKIYFQDQQYEKTLNIFNEMLTKFKLDTEEYHILAKTYWELENYERVILACNKVLNQNITPHASYTNPQTILLRGKAYLKINKIDDALKDFNRAIIEENGFTHLGYSYRALVKIKATQYLEAKMDLDTALSISPNHPYVIFHLGIYFYKKQDFNKAMELFQRARNMDDNILDIEKYIASTLSYLSSEQ